MSEIHLREMEFESRKVEREREIEIREKEIENRKLEWDKEFKLREDEFKWQRDNDAERRKNESTLAARTRKFADATKHVLVKMSEDTAEAPMFFEGLENLYKIYEIPSDIQSKLLLPLLNSKARSITNRLSVKELESYDLVKTSVLAELKLTPREYLQRFKQASKQVDETFTLFKARLSNMLTYYLRSRAADKDIKRLFDLLIADRLKEALPSGALNYVLSQ